MIAASGGGIDLARLLLDLLIVLVAAKAAAEMAERLRVPAVLGEILAGVLVGPSVLGLVELSGDRGVSLGMIAEIGVLLLLLQVGMEMDLGELGKVGRASMLTAVIGVVVPFAAGAGIAIPFGLGTETAIFIGAALTATSVGITARVFGDLRALATTEARVVLGAAVADDVLGLVILTVVVKVVTGGSVGVGVIASTLGLAVLFLLVTGALGLLVVPRLLDSVHRLATSPATVTVVAFAVTIGFAELADSAKLAFIIGAFMAGLGLGRSRQHDRIARDLGSVGNLLIPVFFAQIGINADLGAMFKPSVLGLAAALSVVAVLGKLASAVGTLGTNVDRLLVGLGMIPRGEVGLIFAAIGLSNGVLDADQYGALILVVLLTTLMTPPLLRWRLGRSGGDGASTLDGEVTHERPAAGWLTVDGGIIHLNATPPVGATVSIALESAVGAHTATPSGALLSWFGSHRTAPLTWEPTDTAGLLAVLRHGGPRSWRLLDAAGVLERALPEVADSMRHRRADLGDLDPTAALRFPVAERLHAMAEQHGDASDTLMLAALIADVCTDADDEASCSVSLASRLVPPAEAQGVASLVADAHLLRAGTRHPDAFDRASLLQLATHLGSSEHADEAHRLALAIGGLTTHHEHVLGERLRQVSEALEHPEVTGVEAGDLAAARRATAERIGGDEAVSARLRAAPNAYLLTHEPEELARQARLLEPLPRPGTIRVSVSPETRAERWKIDVACHDARGLLARLTDVLAEFGLEVVSADIATWPDGGVLDSFVVRSVRRPSARELAQAMETALGRPLHLSAAPSLVLTVDDALPWHTSVRVTGPDHPGALGAVAAAFAAADLVVHSARIDGGADGVNDRFALTDRVGRKLDGAALDEVRSILQHGPSRRHLRRRR
ncbi:MAG: High-affinity Na(+)/H(+) antiporter NhaS3 [Actinomycetota bacterium]